MWLLASLLAVQSVCFLVCLWGIRETTRFLQSYPQMSAGPAFEAFKDLARANMKLALMILPLLLTGLALSLALVSRDGLQGLVIVLVINGISVAASLYLGALEKRSRALPVLDTGVAEEYQRVAHAWVHRALPDF